MKRKLLICDDEKHIQDVLKSYFQLEGFQVFTASDGEEGLAVFNAEKPHMVILDIMMPKISGREVCMEIRKTSQVPIIMLTAKIDEEDILRSFDIGADDYVTKPFSPKQVVARVKAVLKRTGLSDVNRISSRDGEIVLDMSKKVLEVRENQIKLTATEYKMMEAFLKNNGKVFSRDQLMDIAIGIDSEGYDRVIDTHIKNLRKKIEIDNKKPKYIITVHGLGYRFGEIQ